MRWINEIADGAAIIAFTAAFLWLAQIICDVHVFW